jgi:hypothetical protein
MKKYKTLKIVVIFYRPVSEQESGGHLIMDYNLKMF